MTQNLGLLDRLIRLFLACGFAALHFTGVIPGGTFATILWIAGVIFFFTAAIGFCPFYRMLHFSTLRKHDG